MKQFLKVVLLFVICFAALNFATSNDAAAYKVYKNTSSVIHAPAKQNNILYVKFTQPAVKTARMSKQLHGWDSKVVSVGQAKSPTNGVKSYFFTCPGYYTIRTYSDTNFKNSTGYMQIYVSPTDAPKTTCNKVTKPATSTPPTREEPDPPIPDPPTPPKPPKKTHPHPKVEATEKPKIVKPAPKPAPKKPKPAVQPPPPAPAETAAERKVRIANEACKRAAEQAHDKWERNKMTSSAGNNDATVVGEDGKVYQTAVTKKMTWQQQQDTGVMNPYEPYNESYSFNLTGDGAEPYECCPIASGVHQAFWKSVGGVDYYQCWTAQNGNVTETYCLDAGDSAATYNSANDNCQIEEDGGYEYAVEEGADIQPLSLEYDDYAVEEFGDEDIEFGHMLVDEPTYESSPDPELGCDLCALFECPGWDEFMGAITDLSNITGGGLTREDAVDLIGTVQPPPVPDIALPPMPNIFDVLEEVDERNPTQPTGDDGFGNEDGFNADDIRQQAPELPVEEDNTGGFNIVDPLQTLPDDGSDAPMPSQAIIDDDIPYPDSNRPNTSGGNVPTPQDTTVDDTATYPTPGTDNISPPSYDGNATPPGYDDTAIYPTP